MMKLAIEKSKFLKSWTLTERSIGTTSTMNVLSGIYIKAYEDGTVELRGTDMKTSITSKATGVQVQEPGEAVLPVKSVGDLFKKAPEGNFTITISDERANLVAGRSRYRFSTYPVSEYPQIPSSENAQLMGVVTASNLMDLLIEGSLGATTDDVYPQYQSCLRLESDGEFLKGVSTDTRILACSSIPMTQSQPGLAFMLPLKSTKELERILASIDSDSQIKIVYDDTQVFFVSQEMEFSSRRIESMFPKYEKIIPQSYVAYFETSRSDILSALERVNVVVRDYNKVVVIRMSPGGSCTLNGTSPNFGEAVEEVDGTIDGEPSLNGFNIGLLMNAIKVIKDPSVRLEYAQSCMVVKRSGSDRFMCLIAPSSGDEWKKDRDKEQEEREEQD